MSLRNKGSGTLTATILLVRHAAHGDLGERLTGRGPEGGLSSEGQAQARALAQSLQGRPILAIYSSPRLRTRQTAEAIASATGGVVQVAAELDEIDFGDWTGCSFAELQGRPAWDRWNSARSTARCPGGESMVEAQARATELVRRVRAQHATGDVVLVTHCDIIRALLCGEQGRSLDEILLFEAGPASVTVLTEANPIQAAA